MLLPSIQHRLDLASVPITPLVHCAGHREWRRKPPLYGAAGIDHRARGNGMRREWSSENRLYAVGAIFVEDDGA